jgi:hypothetical protein
VGKNALFPTARGHCRESQKDRRIEEHSEGEHREESTEREAFQRIEEMTVRRLLAENNRDRDEEESKDGGSQRRLYSQRSTENALRVTHRMH